MRKVIGRQREKEILSNALTSHRSELIAVYGRRRIGKTYLIRTFYKDKITFSFTGLSEGKRHDQIKNFMLKLKEVSKMFQNEKPPKDWLEAFHLLKLYLKGIKESNKKKIIFIDEFPWVDSHKSGFLGAFENFWNDYCTTRSDLIVIVCGSAASYMVKKIINNTKGLSKRITEKIHLKPFNLKETKAFLKYKGILMEEYEILKLYMVLGGVAEYLEHVKKGESATITIDNLCFKKEAYLEDEYNQVFKSLFRENSYHQKIMEVLSTSKKQGITRDDILEELNISSGGRFSNALSDLILSGFVLKYVSYKDHKKTILYRIYDEFCLFHIQFMKNFKGSRWTQLFQQQSYKSWCGFAFETICLKHVEALKRALKCDQIQSKNYCWYDAKAQIDLVIDRNDNVVNLCEIKFYNDTFTMNASYLNVLRTKERQFSKTTLTKKSLYTSIISTWGITENQYSTAIVSNNITMEALFR